MSEEGMKAVLERRKACHGQIRTVEVVPSQTTQPSHCLSQNHVRSHAHVGFWGPPSAQVAKGPGTGGRGYCRSITPALGSPRESAVRLSTG